jgi:four helix bundle protein
MPPFDIRQRTFEFACAIVKLHMYLLQETKTPRRVADQLLGAGTAVGSNLEEAKAAHSRLDFVAKISISLKESRETHFWLRLIIAASLAPAGSDSAAPQGVRRTNQYFDHHSEERRSPARGLSLLAFRPFGLRHSAFGITK